MMDFEAQPPSGVEFTEENGLWFYVVNHKGRPRPKQGPYPEKRLAWNAGHLDLDKIRRLEP